MNSYNQLLRENAELKARLAEAEDTLNAIRRGEVDALVVSKRDGDQVLALENAKHPYRLMVEKMQEGAVTLTTEGMILYCNRYFAGILEDSSEDLISQQLDDYIVPDQREMFQSFLQKVLSEGTDHKEFKCLNQNGQVIPLYISANPLNVDQTQLICLIMTDLTEKNRNEEEIRQSEARYRAVVTTLHEGIIILGSDGVFQECNPSAEQILGQPADQIVGRTTFDPIWRPVREDGSPFLGETHPVTVTLRTSNPVSDVAMGIQQPDDSFRWILINTQPILSNNSDSVLGVVASFTDFTARKEAEQKLQESEARYRTLIEQAADGILVTTEDGRCSEANAVARDLLGYSFEETLEKMIFDIAVIEPDRPLPIEGLQQGQAIRIERDMIRKDGTLFPAEISSRQLPNGNIQFIIRDITERKRTEATLRRSEAALKQAQRVARVGNWVWHIPSNRLEWSDEMYQIFGISRDSFTGNLADVIDQAIHPDDRAAVEKANASVANEKNPIPLEYRIVLPDNSERVVWAEAGEMFLDAAGNPVMLTGIVQDITDRKQAEENLRNLNRTLTLLSNVNQSIVRVRDISKLLREACHIAVRDGGFRMAWIGLLDNQIGHINPVASAGETGDFFESEDYLLLDAPTVKVIADNQPVIVNDIEQEYTAQWGEKTLALGYHAAAVFPLIVGHETRGVFALYAQEIDFFNEAELRILTEMVGDVAFAMEFAAEQEQRHQAELALKAHISVVEDLRVFLQITLDAFAAHTAVLDSDGTIINVNKSWVKFAIENGAPSMSHFIGVNYLTVCESAVGPDSEEARPSAEGVRGVIDGTQDEFHLEYSCHSPTEERWFSMYVTPFPEPPPRRVVLAHVNITSQVVARQEIEVQRYKLHERVKELNCLYQNSKLMEQQGITRDKLFQGTVDLIPAGWQFPEITGARLAVQDEVYSTKNFKETGWRLVSLILVHGERVGLLEVCYREQRPRQFEGPFFEEERQLINELARRLGHKLETMLAEAELHKAHDTLEQRVIERTAELRAAKVRVEAILNSSADAILLVSADLKIEQTNPAFDKKFDCARDDYFRKPLNSIFINNTAANDAILNARETLESLSIDVEVQRKDGTVFPAELTIGFIKDGSCVCIVHDISQRKQIENTLRAAAEKEKELNELKTRFVSMASHEFRTPLASIQASTETLTAYLPRLSEEQIQQRLSNIHVQVGYLKDIMDDILHLSRVQARRTQFNPELIDMDAICREIIDEFQSMPETVHELIYTSQGPLPRAQLDKKLIRQLLSNLLSNAIKYSPANKPISMHLKFEDDMLSFSIRDEGISIPESDIEQLFEPFHRGDNVGTIHGTGLGLVIAKEAVDLHGGSIEIESKPDVGTTFIVRIPIEQIRKTNEHDQDTLD